jgi:hypothetical protein
MSVLAIAKEAFFGSAKLMGIVLAFVIPLMILLECLKEAGLFDWLSSRVGGPVSRVGLSMHSVFPLLVGVVFGVTYGAGAIMAAAREGKMTRGEIGTVALFLGIFHAIFEDTIVFVLIGASWLWLIFPRLILALCFTAALRRWA